MTAYDEACAAGQTFADKLRACGHPDLADLSVGFILRKLEERELHPAVTGPDRSSPYRWGSE